MRSNCFEHKLATIPNTQRQRALRSGRCPWFQIKQSSEIGGVIIQWMKNGGTGLEGLTGDCDSGHAASDDVVSLEKEDTSGGRRRVGRGVTAEKVSKGGASDAAADDAYGGGRNGLGLGLGLGVGVGVGEESK